MSIEGLDRMLKDRKKLDQTRRCNDTPNVYVSSIKITQNYDKLAKTHTLDHYEQLLLSILLYRTPFEKFTDEATKKTRVGHNLNAILYYSNETLAKMMNCSKERARQAKESLHARDIISLDDRSWKNYQLPSGKRFKPHWIQQIRFTQKFIGFFVGIGEHIAWIFDYTKEFFIKLLKRKAAKFSDLEIRQNKLEAIKAMIPPKVETNAPEKTLVISDKEASITLRKSILSTDLFSKSILKPWTDSVTSLVHSLLNSGKNIRDVVLMLQQQNYVGDEISGLKLLKEKLEGS